MLNNKGGMSQRIAEKIFKISQSIISYNLKRKCEINYWKKEKAPDYVDKKVKNGHQVFQKTCD